MSERLYCDGCQQRMERGTVIEVAMPRKRVDLCGVPCLAKFAAEQARWPDGI